MSIRATIKVEIISFWHAGSGLGRAGFLDAQALRDAAGLPYLPGRTLKGLLREGVTLAGECSQLPTAQTVEEIFGQEDDHGRSGGMDSGLFIGDALLDTPTRDWFAVAGNQAKKEHLFQSFASTKLDESSTKLDEYGLAKDKTLRLVELAVPMVLEAKAMVPDETTLAALATGARLVHSLGSHRHRGLGRCQITITANGEGK